MDLSPTAMGMLPPQHVFEDPVCLHSWRMHVLVASGWPTKDISRFKNGIGRSVT